MIYIKKQISTDHFFQGSIEQAKKKKKDKADKGN